MLGGCRNITANLLYNQQNQTTMNTISINYTLIWQFKENPIYQMTRCKKVINTHRGTIVKCVLNGGSIGWWIAGNFVPKNKINQKVELIKKNKLPF